MILELYLLVVSLDLACVHACGQLLAYYAWSKKRACSAWCLITGTSSSVDWGIVHASLPTQKCFLCLC